jgi:hypothetical protein
MKLDRALAVAASFLAFGWFMVPGSANAQQNPAVNGRAVVLEGQLDVLFEDSNAGSHIQYFLQTDTGRVPLRFLQGRGPDLPSGSRVRISGNLADGGVNAQDVTTIVASPARTFGAQSVLVILFNFSNNAIEPYTAASTDSINAQVRDYYLENSYQQTDMSFAVTGWHTIAAINTTCDYGTWADQADVLASNAGFAVTSYARRVYAFPFTSACAWWGMGNVGGPRSWINGTYNTRVVAHEQGHNFGNMHSHAMTCDVSACTSVDYGDDRDVLGAGGVVGHMNAFQKERLGWLNYGTSPTIQTVSANGDYWIANYENVGAESKGLKIWNAAAGKFYYVESRALVGFDASVLGGLTVHTGVPNVSDSSYQIDLDATTTTWDSTLDIGQAFNDAAMGLTITPLSWGSAGAMVRVSFDTQPCYPAAPTTALSPSSQTGAAGATLRFTVTVTNNNSLGCLPSTEAFAANAPAGWSSGFSPATVASVAPGTSASTALSMTVPSGASGSYGFSASVTDSTTGLAASAPGSAGVTAPLAGLAVTASATVTTNKTRTATITVGVKKGTTAVSGAVVTMTVTKPSGGAATTLSATTNRSGVASAKYPLNSTDPSGTYSISATASFAGATGSATATFVVR